MNPTHPFTQRMVFKANPRRKPLIRGDFVEGAYHAWGECRAVGVVRLALEIHVIEFRGTEGYIIF